MPDSLDSQGTAGHLLLATTHEGDVASYFYPLTVR
jgi:hypothetical protein